MDFKQIEAFLCVAKLKSFSKAANMIYLSQPTISSHISSLEKELNTQLFDRTSKEVHITPAGKSFMHYANDIINIRNQAMTELSTFNNNISGTLTLSASTTPCNTILPELLNEFSSIYDEVNFNVKEQNSGQIIKDILDLKCEIGLVGNIVNNDKIKCFKIMEDELVIISNPKLNVPDILSIQDIFKYNFINREKDSATRSTFENLLHNKNLINKLNTVCEVNNLDTLIRLVNTGLGISIVSKNILEIYSTDNLKVSKLKEFELKRNIYFILNSKRTLSPTGNAFFNMCKDKFKLD